jgi:hypothetical protein
LPSWWRPIKHQRKSSNWAGGETQATITGSGFGAQGTSQVQIGTQPLILNTGATLASSPRFPLALHLGTSLSPREPNRAMLFSFRVNGALFWQLQPHSRRNHSDVELGLDWSHWSLFGIGV